MTEQGVEQDAQVKWFNVTKGFGFVELGGGQPDAFLHASVLRPTGHEALAEGAVIRCSVGPGQKGLQVLSIAQVVSLPEPPPPLESGAGGETVEGQIKFFKGDKGYGFIELDDGGDVFVSARGLERSGIFQVTAGQRLRLQVEESPRGLAATAVERA